MSLGPSASNHRSGRGRRAAVPLPRAEQRSESTAAAVDVTCLHGPRRAASGVGVALSTCRTPRHAVDKGGRAVPFQFPPRFEACPGGTPDGHCGTAS